MAQGISKGLTRKAISIIVSLRESIGTSAMGAVELNGERDSLIPRITELFELFVTWSWNRCVSRYGVSKSVKPCFFSNFLFSTRNNPKMLFAIIFKTEASMSRKNKCEWINVRKTTSQIGTTSMKQAAKATRANYIYRKASNLELDATQYKNYSRISDWSIILYFNGTVTIGRYVEKNTNRKMWNSKSIENQQLGIAKV